MADKAQGTFDPRIPTDPRELVTWANARREEGHGIVEREAWLNMSYMLGQQHVGYDNVKKTLTPAARTRRGDPNAPVRITANKIGGLVERTISRLTKSAPIPECRPVSNEDDDVSAAKVGTRTLQHELNRLHWAALLPRLYFWVLPLGWSFLHVYWNPEAGAVAGEDELGEVRQGEVEVRIVPGTEMKIDPNARDWDEVRWCVRSVNMTRAAIYEQYGVTQVSGDSTLVRDLAEDVTGLLAGGSGGYGGGLGGGSGETSQSQRRKVERIAVHQLWLKPGGRQRPEGLVLTWSGDTILEAARPFPYEHNELPFVPFSLLPGIGFAEGRTWMGDLRALQSDYNDARSREATIRRTLVPKILAARGQIDPNRVTSRVEVIDYAPTGPTPSWLVPPATWMQQFEQAMQRADMEMGERAGQAEVSQGNAPAGAPAAAILALQEADESKLAVSAKELGESVERLGFQVLMLARQFWTEERLVRSWSETGKLDVLRFNKADIAGQLDVHVSAESMMPKSKTARAQLALDMWDRQIMTDPAAFIRLLEIPGIGFLQESLDLDTRQAERENERMLFGEDVQPEDWHNHPVHIESGHNKYRKTPEYETEWDDVAKARMDNHIREHYAWIQFQTTGQLPPGIAGGLLPGPGGGGGEELAEGGAPGGASDFYLDPTTGVPPDPLAAASGAGPSALDLNTPGALQGAGRVPGFTVDEQAAAQGS